MPLHLTPEQKQIGKDNFRDVIEVTRRASSRVSTPWIDAAPGEREQLPREQPDERGLSGAGGASNTDDVSAPLRSTQPSSERPGFRITCFNPGDEARNSTEVSRERAGENRQSVVKLTNKKRTPWATAKARDRSPPCARAGSK